MKNFKRFLSILIVSAVLSSSLVFGATDVHTVKSGDSLWIIAQKYQVGISEIIKANSQFSNPNMIFPGDKVNIPLVDAATKSIEEQVLALCNKERANNGLVPLTMNWQVQRVARIKSENMRDVNYFDHTSPTYGSPFDMLKSFNIKYRAAGENIAKGQKTAESVVNAWMNSPGHKKNILSPSFKEIGIGYCAGKGSTYWTQLFITQ